MEKPMKKNTHPEYQKVLFIDSASNVKYLCGTTLKTQEKETFEGKEFPVCRVSISSSSHPFFVGGKQYVDTEGRVDKFKKRYEAMQQKQAGKKQEKEEQEAEEKEKRKKKEPTVKAA